MKLAWLTDIHLNFLDVAARMKFYNKIKETETDAVLISGDIAEAPCLVSLLREMLAQLKQPVYFVLGNHDYYQGKINTVKETLIALRETEKRLHWLPSSGVQVLEEDAVLLGQDGWADGRLGDYTNSRVSLNDSIMIKDLFNQKILGKYPLLEKMQQLADCDANALDEDLKQAINMNPKKIIVLTHVPPFEEACLYEGKISDDDHLPYFSSKVMGDVLTQVARENPLVKFLVLCGHTHSECTYQPLDNLIIRVGNAEYGHPEIIDIINVGGYL